MISKPWKTVGKIIAVLLALPIILVLVFFLINSIDRAPSPTAIEFQQAWDNRKAVVPAENGYIYFFGFDAATDELPTAVGEKRIQLSKDLVKGIASNKDLFRSEYRMEEAFIPEVKRTFDQCANINITCTETIAKNRARIIEWSQAENIASQRYAQLIAHPHWLELAPMDVNLPIPNLSLVTKVQRLAFIHEFAALEQGNANRFVALLDADLRFWRTVLRDTDMLIIKVMAANAIRNNFLWTNYFLLSLDPSLRTAATPLTVQQPFTEEELSMQRSFIGEWKLTSKAMGSTKSNDFDKLSEQLAYQFLFKKQDSINRSAERFKQLIDAQAVTTPVFEAGFAQQDKPTPTPTTDANQKSELWHPNNAFSYYLTNPYNPVGKILLAVATPAYDNYTIRVRDLEAFRSGLLASIEHMNNTPETHLKHTSPYKTKPFVIDQEKRSITVNGLSQGSQAQLVYAF
ncbi:MAG TPA: hypothetical protein VLC79_14145 [Cellvibrio sp.]|nr:hypothetical protein [Cellvibrio sp.]